MQESEKALSSAEVVATARGLVKVFRDFWGRTATRALDGIDLRVSRGELFGLLGPNGSGKSTTIKLILGLLYPTSGEVAILGGSPRDVRRKARVGYLPEESYFYNHLTAREALWFYGSLFSLPRAKLRATIDDLLHKVELVDDADRRLVTFSKGMLRRFGLAQALVNDPDVLILDEPTAGLDPLGTREVKDLLLELKGAGKTVILSSHLLADVEDICDRIAILHRGRVLADGSLDELLRDDRRTQIVTDRLSEASLVGLDRYLREVEGEGVSIVVGRPTTRLEEFFVRLVRSQSPTRVDEGDEQS